MLLNIIGELNNQTIENILETSEVMCPEPLIVNVASEGGNSDVFCVFVDVFKPMIDGGAVTTRAVGEVMSGAPLIVASGSKGKRYSYKHTLFGLHEPFMEEVQGDPATYESERRTLQSTIDRFYTLLSELTDTTVSTWRKRIHGKSLLTFDAKQALKWKLIDKIIGE